MSKKTKLTPAVLDAAADAFAAETASRRSLQQVGIPQRQYPALKAAADEELATFRSKLAARYETILEKMGERLEAEVGKITPGQLPMAIGIIQDKHAALKATVAPESGNFGVPAEERDALMASLLGQHIARIKNVSPKADAKMA